MHRRHGIPQKPKDIKGSYIKLYKYVKKHLVSIIIAICLSVIGSVCSILGPRFLGEITKQCYQPVIDFEYITRTGILLICLYTGSALCSYFCGFLMTGVTQKLCNELRADISTKINKIPLSYFDKTSFGDVLSRVTNDVDSVGQNLNQSITSLISSLTTFIGVTTMMFILSPSMTLIPLISVPVSMFLMMNVVKFSQKFFRSQQKNIGMVNGHIEEAYSGHLIVKSFNREESNLENFEVLNNNLQVSSWKSQFFSGMMMPLMGFVGNLAYISICIFGGISIINGKFGLEYIQMFIQYTRQFNQPIQQFGQIANVLQSCAAAAERVFEFLDEKELIIENPINIIEKDNVNGFVEFENVNFGYIPEKQIIFDFSCKVKPGQKVAIVGPTGAGKTTIVNLLMRFYEVNSGTIYIDGIKNTDISRENVASLFGMVLQDTWLFEGTIRDNLKFGNSEATDEEIINALKAAHMYHYVFSLPGGLDYVLDESANISAGQKQLLTIARAMIENAPMLILDEATSSVDTRTEILIQKAMDNLMKGRTSFVIAHRLSTIRNADLILVMKNGNIIEQGNHDELIELGGFYKELYNSQFNS